MSKEINDLVKGYKRFRQNYFGKNKNLYQDLVKLGQNPKILIISCSDSRVDPSIVLNCQPGDLFVIRNVANLIPAFESDNAFHGTSAALEFGINILKIKHIIIFGHSLCGGINALLSQNLSDKKSFIAKWMQLAIPAKKIIEEKYADETLENKTNICSQLSIINSIENLKTFDWVKDKLNKDLFIHGWYFDLKSGIIQTLDFGKNNFVELK